MKKPIIWTVALVLVGNIIRLFFRNQDVNLAQPFVWFLGTIWFVLFLVYGLVPVVANLVKENKHG